MKIAIPVADGRLTMHFGHCENFELIELDEQMNISGVQTLKAPPHEPGLLPRWLGEYGVTDIIAGGMGQRARLLFAENGIKVTTGAPAEAPEKLVKDYIGGTLVTGDNACDH